MYIEYFCLKENLVKYTCIFGWLLGIPQGLGTQEGGSPVQPPVSEQNSVPLPWKEKLYINGETVDFVFKTFFLEKLVNFSLCEVFLIKKKFTTILPPKVLMINVFPYFNKFF